MQRSTQRDVRRVLLIGSGGAGKSTLATELGAAWHLPVVHLDAHYWSAGWVPLDDAQWRARVAALVAEGAWIMDGNYGGTMPERLAACDMVVFLDLPRLTCVGRVLRRAWRYRDRSRPDMPEGCPEQVTFEFLWWIWTYPSRRRPGILQRLSQLPATTQVVHLRSPREVDAFIAQQRNAPSVTIARASGVAV